MPIMNFVSKVSPASPVYSLLYKMAKQIDNRNDADETYRNIMVLLDDFLQRGYRFESPEIQALVEILRTLPAWGAKRQNFEQRYLRDEYGLRDLPQDPRKLYGQGCWH